ncbi:alpha/beta fold hydrolase [Vibrio sp. M250220]|uniref:thioesterase II family protein n=1 Tax=Vibrio sp. M250220 TaxID=3020894 RepID=UPI002F41946C
MSTIDLFCLPYSGSSATIFYKWRRILADDIHLRPLELAGRGTRMREPLYNSVEEAVSDLYEKFLSEYQSQEYAIFGHSVGGLLAYELAHKIIEKGDVKAPAHLIFSACRPPHLPNEQKVIHSLPNEKFMERIFALGGTSFDVLATPSLAEMFIPIIRADYRLYETYTYRQKKYKIPCPITVLAGARDKLALPESLMQWKKHAGNSDFHQRVFQNAGHFFIFSPKPPTSVGGYHPFRLCL